MVGYETNDDQYSHIGELSVTALAAAGCRGVVVDGGVRDVSFVLEYAFPVFTRYRTPAEAVPRWGLLDWGRRGRPGWGRGHAR